MTLTRLLPGWFRLFSVGSLLLLSLVSSHVAAADLASMSSDTVSKATSFGAAVATLAAVAFGLILLSFIAVFLIGLVTKKD